MSRLEAVLQSLCQALTTCGQEFALVGGLAVSAHLLALKVLSVADERPQDLMDSRSLLAVAGAADVEQAREALGLIDQRGFGRGKQLLQDIDRWAQR